MSANGESTALAPVTEMAPAAQSPQFFRGFDGAATEPFPEAARKILAEPVNDHDVEIKPDGIVFLPGVAWRRILTRAFGAGGWAIVPRTPARVMGNLVIYHGALVALGRFVSEAVGECFYRESNSNMSYASCIEGARTDCVGRCARDLGYAAELWDANWREQWKAKYAISYQGNDGKTKWKLKNRVSNPHDLMAGAGGASPAPEPAVSPASTTPAPIQPADGAKAPDASADTGEAASPEQLDAITARLKELTWKRGQVRLWFNEHFRIVAQEPVRILGALTEQQANAAFALLAAHGTGAYAALLAGLKARGACT